jgi:acyl-CoA reductase-like NAD-dependent aldehyde dehydrogenase
MVEIIGQKNAENISIELPESCRNEHVNLRYLKLLDNGKPIRETRDVDIPLVAAHFFYHAGWADKLDYAGSW